MSRTTSLRPETASDTRAVTVLPLYKRVFTWGATWVFLLDVALVLFFALLSRPGVFFSLPNLQNLMLNGAAALLLALAMAMLLAAGLIDLSVGANLVLSSVVASIVMVSVGGGRLAILSSEGGSPQVYSNAPLAIAAGLVAAIITGALFGLVNGLIITVLKVNSLIATLGTLSVATGAVLLVTRGSDIGGLPNELQLHFGLVKVLGLIPLPAVVALGVAIALWLVVRYLRFGLHTVAIGSSTVAAERAGIKVRNHILKLTMLAGGIAGLAGFLSLAQFGATTINGHANDPLAAITAAVIGGAALHGGRISIVGTVWGAALALILLSGLVILGVSAFWQLIVIGSILIVAVAIDQFRARRRESR